MTYATIGHKGLVGDGLVGDGLVVTVQDTKRYLSGSMTARLSRTTKKSCKDKVTRCFFCVSNKKRHVFGGRYIVSCTKIPLFNAYTG